MDPILATYGLEIATVELTGRLDAFQAAPLREILDGHLEVGKTRIIVDLSDVEFVDSAGLAALVKSMKEARERGGDLRLVSPTNENALRVFELSRFDKIFTMADSLADALVNW